MSYTYMILLILKLKTFKYNWTKFFDKEERRIIYLKFTSCVNMINIGVGTACESPMDINSSEK